MIDDDDDLDTGGENRRLRQLLVSGGAILGAVIVWAIWAASGTVISGVFPAEQQARAATLQIVMIGLALCAMLLLRPRGILPEGRTVSRHIEDLARGRRQTDRKGTP